MTFETRRRSMIKEGEGSISHLYLDTKGLVTVAVGQLLRTVEAAQELGFVRRATGEPATGAEIELDYDSVKRQSAAMVASAYKPFTELDLPEPAITALLDKRIEGFEAGLRSDFSDYESFPDEVRLGLMDMVFNLGNRGLVDKFPTFTRAARAKDWETCSAECRRTGIGDRRNEETKRLFETAAAGER